MSENGIKKLKKFGFKLDDVDLLDKIATGQPTSMERNLINLNEVMRIVEQVNE